MSKTDQVISVSDKVIEEFLDEIEKIDDLSSASRRLREVMLDSKAINEQSLEKAIFEEE